MKKEVLKAPTPIMKKKVLKAHIPIIKKEVLNDTFPASNAGTSSKSRKQYPYDNFIYKFERARSTRSYYKCYNYSSGCKARLIVFVDAGKSIAKPVAEHNHKAPETKRKSV